MKWLRAILPHAVLVLAVMFLVLLVLHEFNPYMNFIGSGVSRLWLLAFCVLAAANALVCIVRDRHS
ncbi:MAG: hypothetical protein IJ705_05055 [Oscillospiraceae bacterium]|nr:hypothetical protein [Oscillospiraceae bacterium]